MRTQLGASSPIEKLNSLALPPRVPLPLLILIVFIFLGSSELVLEWNRSLLACQWCVCVPFSWYRNPITRITTVGRAYRMVVDTKSNPSFYSSQTNPNQRNWVSPCLVCH
jgi:hypothetical protein